jgi:hypothetical protein
MSHNIPACLETPGFLDTRRRQMGQHTSEKCRHEDTKRVVRSTRDVQYTAGVSCDRLIMEYTHDE